MKALLKLQCRKSSYIHISAHHQHSVVFVNPFSTVPLPVPEPTAYVDLRCPEPTEGTEKYLDCPCQFKLIFFPFFVLFFTREEQFSVIKEEQFSIAKEEEEEKEVWPLWVQASGNLKFQREKWCFMMVCSTIHNLQAAF